MVSVDSVNIWALVDFPAWNLSILSAQEKHTFPGTRSSPTSWWRRAEGRECLPSLWRELHEPLLLCVSRISFHIDPGCGPASAAEGLLLTLHFWWRYNLSPASCAWHHVIPGRNVSVPRKDVLYHSVTLMFRQKKILMRPAFSRNSVATILFSPCRLVFEFTLLARFAVPVLQIWRNISDVVELVAPSSDRRGNLRTCSNHPTNEQRRASEVELHRRSDSCAKCSYVKSNVIRDSIHWTTGGLCERGESFRFKHDPNKWNSAYIRKSILLHRTPFRDHENQKVEGKEKVLEILKKPYHVLQMQFLQEGKLSRHALVTGKEISRKVTHAHTGIDLNA